MKNHPTISNTISNTMKLVITPLVLVYLLLSLTTSSKAQLITNIGQFNNSNFLIEEGATTASNTQDNIGINFTGSYNVGATLGGLFLPGIPKDWSIYQLSDFGLVMNINGPNPNMGFSIEFYDSSLSIANTFSGSTTTNNGSDVFMPLTLSVPGSGSMNEIQGIQFTWDTPDTIDATLKSVAVVPEPSTYALLVISLAGLLIQMVSKRKQTQS